MHGCLDRPARRRRSTGWPACAAPRRRAARRSTRRSRATCAGARGDRPGPVPKRVEAAPEPCEQCIRGQQSDAGGGELDGERQAVEPPADLGHGERVVLGQREVVAHGLGSIDEQLHRGQRGQLLDRRPVRKRRHRQRADRVLALGPQAQHGAARREDLEAGAAGQELVELRRARRRPARGCPARAGSAAVGECARPGRPEAGARPRWTRPARPRCGAAPARAERWMRAARTPRPAGSDRPGARPTAIASRVLPMPPGPVRVTSRTPGVSSSSETSSMSRSRPINDVEVTGSERGAAGRCSPARHAGSRRVPALAREPLAQQHGEVVADESPELPRGDGTIRYESVPSAWSSSIMAVEPRLPVGRRCLDIQQPGHRRRRAGTRLRGPRSPCPARSSRTAASTGR